MTTTQFVILLIAVVLLGVGAIAAVILTRRKDDMLGDLFITYKNENERALERTGRDIKEDVDTRLRYMYDSLKNSQEASADQLAAGQEAFFGLMTEKQNSINAVITANSASSEDRYATAAPNSSRACCRPQGPPCICPRSQISFAAQSR